MMTASSSKTTNLTRPSRNNGLQIRCRIDHLRNSFCCFDYKRKILFGLPFRYYAFSTFMAIRITQKIKAFELRTSIMPLLTSNVLHLGQGTQIYLGERNGFLLLMDDHGWKEMHPGQVRGKTNHTRAFCQASGKMRGHL
jgi:hypothetical protein